MVLMRTSCVLRTMVLTAISWFCFWHDRDMKEKMAGPGDKYAKDTRKYNPDFAAEHPEDEYDNKIEEVNEILCYSVCNQEPILTLTSSPSNVIRGVLRSKRERCHAK